MEGFTFPEFKSSDNFYHRRKTVPLKTIPFYQLMDSLCGKAPFFFYDPSFTAKQFYFNLTLLNFKMIIYTTEETNGGLKPILVYNFNFQPEANLHVDALIWLDGHCFQSHMKTDPLVSVL